MPAKAKPARSSGARTALAVRVKRAMALLEKAAAPGGVEGMARYGIVSKKRVLGTSVGSIRQIAKQFGRDQELSLALWQQECYEARMLAVFVAVPAEVTPAQMETWCKSFENWADTDTACFHLFDKTPYALKKIEQWAKRKPEFEKRAAFALLASLALHDKKMPDAPFLKLLPLIERHADDDRNFVKKGVLWALRGVGGRSPNCKTAAIAVANRLAERPDKSARWIGKTALRELQKKKR